MKKRVERLQLLVTIKENNKQQKMINLGNIKKQFNDEKLKNHQLIKYKADYNANLNQQGQGGLTMSTLKHTSNFIQQLDKLIEQQFLELNNLQKEVSTAHNEYLQSKIQVDSLESLLVKMNSTISEQESKLLQKLCDETIQNQWYYANKHQE